MFTNSEQLAIGLLEFKNKGKIARLMKAVNSLRIDGFNDDQINLIVLDVSRAIFSEQETPDPLKKITKEAK
jgi:hypothetical protein